MTGWRAGNITTFDRIFSKNDKALIRTTLFRNKVDDEISRPRVWAVHFQQAVGGMGDECAGLLPMANYLASAADR